MSKCNSVETVRRGAAALSLLVAALGLPGGAQAQSADIVASASASYSVPVTSLKGARFISTLRQQYDFSCGSAAVATLLTHQYGYPVDEATVFRSMFVGGDQAKIRREGFSMLDMKRYLDAAGFQAHGLQVSLDELTAAGLPAIALVNENGYFHFVVIKGVREGRVVIGDPAMGTRVMARADFEQYWTNGILLVVSSKMESARFNRASDWNVLPRAPLAERGIRDTVDVLLLRPGAMDF